MTNNNTFHHIRKNCFEFITGDNLLYNIIPKPINSPSYQTASCLLTILNRYRLRPAMCLDS